MDVVDSNTAVGDTFWGRVFDAQGQGAGPKKTDYPIKHEFIAWEYTRHNDDSGVRSEQGRNGDGAPSLKSTHVRQEPNAAKGLSTTRYHKGFRRRMQPNIRQDEARLQYEARKQQRSVLHLDKRRQRLGNLDKRNGFDLITGHFDPANRRCTTPFHIQPKMRNSGSLSEVAERAEYLLLRDSEYKFHAPAWSGKNHDQRQDLLLREGINTAKKSTLLGIGTSDLASVGAEDMFSKSVYDPAKACAVEGLIEKSVPGRFTPRKRLEQAATVAPAATTASRGSSLQVRTPSPPLSDRSSNHIDGRPSSPATETTGNPPANVFRVIPIGLGSTNTQKSRRGNKGPGYVPGIAPPKPLCGSQSAPTLRRTSGREGSTPASLNFIQRGLPLSTRTSGSPVSGKNDDRALSREFTRSQSNFKGGKSTSGNDSITGDVAGAVDGGISDLQRGRSTQSSPSRSGRSSSRVPTSESGRDEASGSATNRGVSPALRRSANQLAFDVAAVRSLDIH